MTHDELLAIVSTNQAFLEWKEQPLLAKGMSALRAVVELHKPKEVATSAGTNEPFGYTEVCNVCSIYQAYPCPTIQAIEKELEVSNCKHEWVLIASPLKRTPCWVCSICDTYKELSQSELQELVKQKDWAIEKELE